MIRVLSSLLTYHVSVSLLLTLTLVPLWLCRGSCLAQTRTLWR